MRVLPFDACRDGIHGLLGCFQGVLETKRYMSKAKETVVSGKKNFTSVFFFEFYMPMSAIGVQAGEDRRSPEQFYALLLAWNWQ